jgi:hypothetical protein
MTCIKSHYDNDQDIIRGIEELHNNGEPFELDVSFGRGMMYRDGVQAPKRKFDIAPQLPGVERADCQHLPFTDASVSSIIADLPHMFGNHGTNRPGQAARGYSDPGAMNAAYSQFASFEELSEVYRGALKEAARILRPKGLLVFKCCNFTDKRTTFTHCEVWQWAQAAGFYPKDLLIRTVNAGRAYNPALVQRHARKFHSYWWVFVKA